MFSNQLIPRVLNCTANEISPSNNKAACAVLASTLLLQKIGVECQEFVHFEGQCLLEFLFRIKDLSCSKEKGRAQEMSEGVSHAMQSLSCPTECHSPHWLTGKQGNGAFFIPLFPPLKPPLL